MKKFVKWAGIGLTLLLVLSTVVAVAAPAKKDEGPSPAQIREDRLLDKRERALEQREAALNERELALDERDEQLTADAEDIRRDRAEAEDRVEQAKQEAAEVEAATEAAKPEEISDGTWEVGSDLSAGTYRAAGGEYCYWEIRTSAHAGGSIDEILENGLGKNPTVTLSEGQWFESNECGTWTEL
jgi:hypothetical protein